MSPILAQGAEALIIQKGSQVLKRRVKKSYRLPILDEKIRKLRTRTEAKLLEKSLKLIPTPKILRVSEKDKEIDLEFIKGKKLSNSLDKLKNKLQIAKKIGENIAKLHDNNIIHGDLTTSNMIYVNNNTKDKKIINNKKNSTNNYNKYTSDNKLDIKFQVYFIDFGLSFTSVRAEDKAVDLHLIKQALEARHFKFHSELFNSILQGYKSSKNSKEVLNRLKKVELRGRYKQQY